MIPNSKENILKLKHLHIAVINRFNPFENKHNTKSILIVKSSDQIISCLETQLK